MMINKIGNIASYKRNHQLLKTIHSVINQVDELNIFLNDFEGDLDEIFFNEKVNLFFTNNEYGDGYKFLKLLESDGYYFTFDDDLIYPTDYVNTMIEKIDFYDKKKILTLHGKKFSQLPIQSYYNSNFERFHFIDENVVDIKVDVGGTGVMAFHTDVFKFDYKFMFKKNMTDVWISKFAKEQNIDIVCIRHPKNYIIQQQIGQSIYDNSKNNDFFQTKIINETFYNNGKKDISIIVPTFNSVTFIQECINSILKSVINTNVEIIIGIDNCKETLNYLKNKFFENVKFFYFNNHSGPYIIKNSLAKIANSDILLFFDSDDIMKENMISEILEKMKNNDFVKPMYSDFTNSPNYNITKSNTYGEGVFSITKELFLSMNGFEPWPIAADSDFMTRLYKNNKKFDYTSQVVFYRRQHPNSLTQKKETNYGSILRHEYHKKMKSKKYFGPLDYLHIEKFVGVTIDLNVDIPNEIKKKDNSELLNSILNQTKRQTKVIDYDKVSETLQKDLHIEPSKPLVKQNKPQERQEIVQLKKDSLVATNRKLLQVKPNRRNDLPNIFSKKR